MAVTPPQARDLARARARALADAAEAPHFHHLASRTPRRIFATLDASVPDLNLMFDPDLRDFYRTVAPRASTPVPGGRGHRDATRCDLTASALKAAHRLACRSARQIDLVEHDDIVAPARRLEGCYAHRAARA